MLKVHSFTGRILTTKKEHVLRSADHLLCVCADILDRVYNQINSCDTLKKALFNNLILAPRFLNTLAQSSGIPNQYVEYEKFNPSDKLIENDYKFNDSMIKYVLEETYRVFKNCVYTTSYLWENESPFHYIFRRDIVDFKVVVTPCATNILTVTLIFVTDTDINCHPVSHVIYSYDKNTLNEFGYSGRDALEDENCPDSVKLVVFKRALQKLNEERNAQIHYHKLTRGLAAHPVDGVHFPPPVFPVMTEKAWAYMDNLIANTPNFDITNYIHKGYSDEDIMSYRNNADIFYELVAQDKKANDLVDAVLPLGRFNREPSIELEYFTCEDAPVAWGIPVIANYRGDRWLFTDNA